MTYSKTLPAPGTLINSAGILDPAGLPAPGFSGLNLAANDSSSLNRTRSNRGWIVDDSSFYWSFTISYHPMTVTEWAALENFLFGHNTRKRPFYVTLPNYSAPSDSALATHLATNNAIVSGDHFAGDTQITLNVTGFPNQNFEVGGFFNVEDPDDALHKSTYKVARVETNTAYSGVQPAANQVRLTIHPPLQRDTPNTVPLRFINPLFRVIQTNNITPNYDENNIVSINLQVEEILP